jgi:hypothetical protein
VLARPTWCLLAATLLTLAPACRKPSPTGVQLDRRIREPSGIVASRTHADIFWTHGDSGRAPKIFAIDPQGALVAELRVAEVDNVDWEDIALDDHGNLWIGDIGNNDSDRKDLVVYRVAEPDPHAGLESVGVDQRVHFSYPDQDDFSDSRGPFDAEALFWWSGSLWLATKHRRDTLTVLYRFPQLDQLDIDEVVLERVAEWDLGTQLGDGYPVSEFPGMATGADVSADQKQLALLSYDAVFVFELAAGQADPFAGKVNRIALDPSHVDQVEAVAWAGEQLLLVNEDGAVFRIGEVRTRQRYPDE